MMLLGLVYKRKSGGKATGNFYHLVQNVCFHFVEQMCHEALCELQVSDLYRNLYPRVNYRI